MSSSGARSYIIGDSSRFVLVLKSSPRTQRSRGDSESHSFSVGRDVYRVHSFTAKRVGCAMAHIPGLSCLHLRACSAPRSSIRRSWHATIDHVNRA